MRLQNKAAIITGGSRGIGAEAVRLFTEQGHHVRFLYEKNYVGYRNHVKSLNLSSIDKQRLLQLLNLRGGEEKIKEALNHIEQAEIILKGIL